jgi:hypothetical protein
MTPFDFLKAINESKKDLMTDSENDELAERAYTAFIVNRGLSFFPDTILYANEMNRLHILDNKPQFAYLLNSVRSRKRYSKWLKNELDEDIKIISEYYDYSYAKAKQVANLITPEQLKTIKEKIEKGGLKTKEKK